MKNRLFQSLTLGLLLLLTGCTSVDQSSSWRDPQFTGPRLTKVLVAVGTSEQTQRRIFEDSLILALSTQAVAAKTSYSLVPDVQMGQSPDYWIAQMQSGARAAGYKGLLTLRTVSTEKRIRTSGPSYGVGFGGWGRWGWGGYGGWPAAASEYEVLTLEATVWSESANKLIWSATYKLIDPENTEKFAEKLSKMLVEQLAKEGVI